MDQLISIITFINDNILWGIPLIVAILGTGIVMTIRTKGFQVRKFGDSISSTIVPTVKGIFKKKDKEKSKDKKTVSQFEAFAAAISGTVGTGNIVGIAGAMLSGGPGAVFWMWVSAFFGLITNYSENVLGLYYRKRNAKGEMCGGPMYYISNGMNCKWLALIFALCCSLAAVGMGMVQSNSMAGTLQSAFSGGDEQTAKIIGIVVGVVVVILTALIVIGGIKRIGRIASIIVPFMALFFIILAVVIICINITAVPAAFALIFQSAFSFKAVGGGMFGYMLLVGMRYGFARGVFSNEAGLGSSVIAHSASDTKEPVKQGLWGIFEVFLDTFVICTLTAISLITVSMKSGALDFTNIVGNSGIGKNDIASMAFTTTFGQFGEIAFAIILPLFAFTTILAWSYYGEKAVEYLFGEKYGKKFATAFKFIYVGLLFVGAIAKSELVWQLDDMFNALMALPNLISVIALSGIVVQISKNYYDRKKGLDVAPMLSAYPEVNEQLAKSLEDKVN
ncbi:MAG: alanine:cation symporter family protein [Clostridia bacterium]|nr:alanine:cation symporter family protein [Clostridia bacterium]